MNYLQSCQFYLPRVRFPVFGGKHKITITYVFSIRKTNLNIYLQGITGLQMKGKFGSSEILLRGHKIWG